MSDLDFFKGGKFNWNTIDNIIVILAGLAFTFLNPDLWYGGICFVIVGMFGKVALEYLAKIK